MSNISIILTSIFFMVLLLYLAPSVISTNRGKLLQNIALWLLVFVFLGLIYKNFGPDSPSPMFHLPQGLQPFAADLTSKQKEKTSADKSEKDTQAQPDKEAPLPEKSTQTSNDKETPNPSK